MKFKVFLIGALLLLVGQANAHTHVNGFKEADVVIDFESNALHENMKAKTEDSYYQGDAVEVKGHYHKKWPIIQPAGSFTRNVENGEHVRMFLKKHPDKDVYYPIAIVSTGEDK